MDGMSENYDTPATRVRRLRQGVLREVHAAAKWAVNTPPGRHERPKTLMTVCRTALDLYGKMLTESSTSSSPTYAERDLSEDEKTMLAEARHYVRILESLYGDQPVSA